MVVVVTNIKEEAAQIRLLKPGEDGALEIDISALAALLWHKRKMLIVFSFLFMLAALTFAFLQDDIYVAEAMLAPAEVRQSASPLVSQLGAAAGLVGISVGEPSSQASNAIAVLESREFTRSFIHKHDLLPMLMASQWSEREGRNVIDSALYDVESGAWLRGTTPAAPSDWQAFNRFSSILGVQQDRTTGMITVSIQWPDPQQAAQWVNWLVDDINDHFKQRDMEEANNAIRYLQTQLQGTQLVEMQRVFYQLIESQTRVVMLADVRDEYVFQIVDPAVVPEQPIAPDRVLIVLAGFVIGLLAGVIAAVAHHNQLQDRFFGLLNKQVKPAQS